MAQNRAYGLSASSDTDPNNPFASKELESVANAGGSLVKTAIRRYTYGKNGNLLAKAEYDWVDYGVRAGTGVLRGTVQTF